MNAATLGLIGLVAFFLAAFFFAAVVFLTAFFFRAVAFLADFFAAVFFFLGMIDAPPAKISVHLYQKGYSEAILNFSNG